MANTLWKASVAACFAMHLISTCADGAAPQITVLPVNVCVAKGLFVVHSPKFTFALLEPSIRKNQDGDGFRTVNTVALIGRPQGKSVVILDEKSSSLLFQVDGGGELALRLGDKELLRLDSRGIKLMIRQPKGTLTFDLAKEIVCLRMTPEGVSILDGGYIKWNSDDPIADRIRELMRYAKTGDVPAK